MFQYVFSLSPTFLQTSKKKKSIKQKHQFSQMPTLVIEFTESLIRLCKNTMDFQESWWNSAGTSTAKRQSHHSPVSFQTPQWRRRIQYVISLSSLMVLPTLIAHATRPKILSNFAKFHWISPFCMVTSRKKQCSVSIFCSTLQCNRGTETM